MSVTSGWEKPCFASDQRMSEPQSISRRRPPSEIDIMFDEKLAVATVCAEPEPRKRSCMPEVYKPDAGFPMNCFTDAGEKPWPTHYATTCRGAGPATRCRRR